MSQDTKLPAVEDTVDDESARPSTLRRLAVLLGIVVALSLAVLGWTWARPDVPAESSADVGFARAMQVHHAQAVQMSFLIRDRTDDPTIRTIAFDIITSQQQQIGQMFGWLEMWQLPQTTTGSLMAWMSGGHQGSMAGMSGGSSSSDMPGMASEQQLQALEDAKGVEAEKLFLQLMIAHHRGGVEMARAALNQADDPRVLDLAGAIETAQLAEIEQMKQLLRDREGGTTR